MKVILVSGTTGTGKTTIAKKLAKKHNYEYIDLNHLLIKKKLYSGYDRKLKTHVVDQRKSNKLMIALIKEAKESGEKGLVIDSHLSHLLPARHADLCIITKTGLRKLKGRLQKRKYPEEKIKENLEAEILDVCLVEALETGHKVKVIKT